MIKKNVVKKKACAATSGCHTSIKPVSGLIKAGLDKPKLIHKSKPARKYRSYKDYLFELLQDKEFALGYMSRAIGEEDQKMFMIAIKNIVMSQKGGIAEVAKKIGLSEQSFCRMLDSKSKLSWKNLKAIFDMLGLQVRLGYKKK